MLHRDMAGKNWVQDSRRTSLKGCEAGITPSRLRNCLCTLGENQGWALLPHPLRVYPRMYLKHFRVVSGCCQTVCKPGSVPGPVSIARPEPGDGHSSGTPVTGRLARPTRA